MLWWPAEPAVVFFTLRCTPKPEEPYWYNCQRLHCSIADVPLVEYEQAFENQRQSLKAQ